MDLSIYLARLISLVLGIMGLAILSRIKTFQKVVHEIGKSHALLTIIGMLTIIAGSAIVVGHSIRADNWTIIITLLGYLFLLIGVVRIFFQDQIMDLCLKAAKSQTPFIIAGLTLIILSVILGYLTFN